MYKEFVSHDIALTLKELGFDEPCWAWWHIEDCDTRYCYSDQRSPIQNSRETEIIGLPTFSQCFKWFREKHGLMHVINPYDFTAEIDSLKERIVDEKYGDFIPHHHIIDDEGEEIKHSSYEEAEGACLEKLIEIVKNSKH